MIRILLVDDHSVVREGLKKILEKEPDIKVSGEAGNSDEVLKFIKNKDCDIVILDINLPGRSGLDIVKDIKKFNNNIKILVLSIYPEYSFAFKAHKLGVSGYLTKDVTTEELLKAIRKINNGRKYVSEILAERLASRIDQSEVKQVHEKLSSREFQILLLIGKGKSLTKISEELFLSYNTVYTYRNRILEKMGMNSNAELIHYLIKNNLLD